MLGPVLVKDWAERLPLTRRPLSMATGWKLVTVAPARSSVPPARVSALAGERVWLPAARRRVPLETTVGPV